MTGPPWLGYSGTFQTIEAHFTINIIIVKKIIRWKATINTMPLTTDKVTRSRMIDFYVK